MYKPALSTGALCAALAVILGAFGAHSLKAILSPDQLVIFEKGVQYQFYHSFALLVTGIVYMAFPQKSIRLASTFFFVGILLFSGSLYAMTLLSTSGISLGPIGIVTPIGGLCFIIGWFLLLAGIMKRNVAAK
jgi:uncharacterized membrane protein YgdD (TMEM256/DUF423 family)